MPKAKNIKATCRNHGPSHEALILTEDKHEDIVVNAHGPHERGCRKVTLRCGLEAEAGSL